MNDVSRFSQVLPIDATGGIGGRVQQTEGLVDAHQQSSVTAASFQLTSDIVADRGELLLNRAQLLGEIGGATCIERVQRRASR